MGWTKLELVDQALAELSLSDSQGFDITPEEKQRCLRAMDAMLATWAGKGVRIHYAFPSGPDTSDLNADSGIPDSAAETVYLNLARRISSGFGKTLSPETLKNARDGYDTLLWSAAQPIEQQMPNTMPRGAGNKPWRTANRQFMPRPDEDPLRVDDQSGDLDILQE